MLSQSRANASDIIPFKKDFSLTSRSARKRSGKWECKLPETVVGEYLIIPIVSTKMLKSEGYWMNNCCREYVSQCSLQNYSLFSIRTRSGERLATLGLENDCGSWRFDQCYGPSHSDVLEERFEYVDEDDVLLVDYYPTEMYYVVHEVVRLMNSPDKCH